MAIDLITWGTQEVLPVHDAIINDVGVGASGILYGCEVTKAGNVLTVGTGYGLIKGRLFQIDEAVDIPVALASDATLYGMVYVRLDLSNTEEPITIEVDTDNTQYALTQEENANYIEGVYEICLATFSVTTTEITDLSGAYNPILYGSLSDMYYHPGETIRLAVSGGGTLTAGKTAIMFALPLNRLTGRVSAVTLAPGSSLTIRQDGAYLMGSGSGGAAIGNAYNTSFDLLNNCIRMTLTKPAGFGGVNNAPVAVVGSVVVTFS